MTIEEYNDLLPIGTVILPVVFCTTSFTVNMFKEEKQKALKKEIFLLNKNNFGAVWAYKYGLGIVRIK